jgi:hypothetical protein
MSSTSEVAYRCDEQPANITIVKAAKAICVTTVFIVSNFISVLIPIPYQTFDFLFCKRQNLLNPIFN